MENNIIELWKFAIRQNEWKKKTELGKKYDDRLCSKEIFRFTNERQRAMFVGNTKLAVGSRIKEFLWCDGLWKPKQHSWNAVLCVTNEGNAAQTYVLRFRKSVPLLKIFTNEKGEGIVKKVDVFFFFFVCWNKSCPSVKYSMSTHGRDLLSALVIAFSGASNLILNMPCPTFNPKINEINADAFQKFCHLFFFWQETRSGPLSMKFDKFKR